MEAWLEAADYYLFASHGATLVFEAELNQSTINILVSEGRQGIGKSTYLYNIMRAGLLKRKLAGTNELAQLKQLRQRWQEAVEKCGECEEAVRAKEEYFAALRGALRGRGVSCWGAFCEEPDRFDLRHIKPYIFTTNKGMEELLQIVLDVIEGKREPLPRVFLDDVAVYRDVFLMGGVERKLYIELKRLYQYRRAFANILGATALTRETVMKELIRTSVVIEAAEATGGVAFTRWVVKRHPAGYAEGLRYYRYMIFKAWSDVVPRRKQFGAPKWLDEMMMQRKREATKAAAERALNALKE